MNLLGGPKITNAIAPVVAIAQWFHISFIAGQKHDQKFILQLSMLCYPFCYNSPKPTLN